MIIATADSVVNRRLGGARPASAWMCLARRGMLHSECEAIDLVVLPPAATLDRHGRDGVGELWFVLAGEAETGDGLRLTPGHLLVITPDDRETRLTAQAETRVLTISVLGAAATAALPVRTPTSAPIDER